MFLYLFFSCIFCFSHHFHVPISAATLIFNFFQSCIFILPQLLKFFQVLHQISTYFLSYLPLEKSPPQPYRSLSNFSFSILLYIHCFLELINGVPILHAYFSSQNSAFQFSPKNVWNDVLRIFSQPLSLNHANGLLKLGKKLPLAEWKKNILYWIICFHIWQALHLA